MKLRLLYCLLAVMAFGITNVNAQPQDYFQSQLKPLIVADEVDVKLKTVHPYQTLKAGVVFEKEFYSKNSSYIKLYFRNFDLAPGDYVEIYSPKTNESLIYAGKGKIVDDGAVTISDFWSQLLLTDKVIVRLHTAQASTGYGFDLETVAYGFSEERILALQEGQQRAICSGDEKERIACYEGTEMFEKAKAVCRLIRNGSGLCTGWLLGCEGNLMTNNHCIGNATSARNTDYQFNYQNTGCTGNGNARAEVVGPATFVKTSGSVDATILKLPAGTDFEKYGYLSLRSKTAAAGERIYIPQHAGARRKEIAVKEGNGTAKIQSIRGSRDLQYLTDTEGGSSGSPVLDFNTHLVLGIHNTGGCPNGAEGGNERLLAWLGSDVPKCGIDDDNMGVQKPVSKFNVAFNCRKATFTNTSQNGASYAWNFGDGNTSTQESPTHTYDDAGQYNVILTVTNAAGTDREQFAVTVQDADAPRATSQSVCEGESATFDLQGNGGFVWYDKASGGNVVGTGAKFETGALTDDTDFYVSGTSQAVRKGSVGVDAINTGSGGNHQGGFFLVFDAAEKFILRSAKVLAEGAGNRTLELRNAAGDIVQTKVINIPDGESVIDINLNIAAGEDLQIGFASGANLFRSNDNLRYPYVYNAANKDIVSIKGSTASVPTNFYYYLYDWEVNTVGSCETGNRTKISVSVDKVETPEVTANQNSGQMTVDSTFSSYKWFFNGTAINGATSRSYTATQNGTYTVEVSNGSCETISKEIEFGTLSNDKFEWPLGVSIYPNPTKDVLNIKGLNTLENVKQVKVINMIGQTVKTHHLNTVLETTTLNVQELSKGLYFLNIDNKYTTKFVVK